MWVKIEDEFTQPPVGQPILVADTNGNMALVEFESLNGSDDDSYTQAYMNCIGHNGHYIEPDFPVSEIVYWMPAPPKPSADVSPEQAKQQLTQGDHALDEIADMLLSRVAEFMGEIVSSPEFCAVGVDVKRDTNGRLQYLRLVPCDEVGGVPARRWPKE